MHVAAALEFNTHLMPALNGLQTQMEIKANAIAGIIKLGRMHLQDATPLTQ